MKFNLHLAEIERKEMGPMDPNKRRLNMCERTLPFSDSFFSSFKNSLTQEDFIYYSSDIDLRIKLAEFNGVSKENIYVAAGSDSVLNTLFDVFVSPGSEVVMPEAHFPMYDVYLKQNQGKKITFKYQLVDNKLKLNTEIYCGPNVNLIIIGNPNSPVGDLVSLAEIEKLTLTNIPIVLDQAYGEFGKTEVPLSWIDKGIVFVNSFSKGIGSAGCRIGYCIANKEIVDLLNKRKRMFEISSISKKFAIHLLNNFQEVNKYVNQIVVERELLKRRFNLIQFGNWLHLDQDKYLGITDKWEVKVDATLPLIPNKFIRMSIFPGINEHI